jgi:hypothetical protein
VQIAFPEGAGLVRLDQLDLTFTLRHERDPVKVSIEWPKDSRSVSRNRSRRLAKNVLFGSRASPRIVYRCPRAWEAYKVRIELGFAWIPVPTPKRARLEGLVSGVNTRLRARTLALLGRTSPSA